MTTKNPDQLALVGRDELAAHYEGRLLVRLHRITSWAATPDDTSIDWDLERELHELRVDAEQLRDLRGEDDIPF